MLKRVKLASPKAVAVLAVVAMVTLGAGSATAKTLITGDDIKNGTVTGADIHNGSLHLADLDSRAIDGLGGAKGATGATGLSGAKGADGLAGAKGADGLVGAKGADGLVGPRGTNGLVGPEGADGLVGPRGTNGLVGPNGNDGLDGANGTDGVVGPKGADGVAGAKGADGAAGANGANAKYQGANWNIVDRNVIGNGDSYLRSGPFSTAWGTAVQPPLGQGSLGIRTGSGLDAASFGDEVDFAGNLVSGLTNVGFSVYTTNENQDMGGNNQSFDNLPSISFEINPHLGSATYTSMTYVPPAGTTDTAGKWTSYDSATEGGWYLSSGSGACVLGPELTSLCSLAAIKAAVPEATIYTVQITKPRISNDHPNWAFSGAVDALRINGSVYDFEPLGVVRTLTLP
jgi:Collagen triple helix repeat (20 copies)